MPASSPPGPILTSTPTLSPLYSISVQDNRSYMVGSCDVPDPAAGCPACLACGFRTDPDFTAPHFRLRSKRYDRSCCYDGAIIASHRFREACERIGADSRLRFVPLSGAPGFFRLVGAVPVALDDGAMGTELQGPCPTCNRYANRTGSRHAVLQPGQGGWHLSWPARSSGTAATMKRLRCC